jgi:hypothetical protein
MAETSAYVNGFPMLAEGLYVIMKTSPTKYSVFFCGERCMLAWMLGVWTQSNLFTLIEGLCTDQGLSCWLKASVIGEGVYGPCCAIKVAEKGWTQFSWLGLLYVGDLNWPTDFEFLFVKASGNFGQPSFGPGTFQVAKLGDSVHLLTLGWNSYCLGVFHEVSNL